MSARPFRSVIARTARRRTLVGAVVAALTAAGFLTLGAAPASAAGTWYVAPTGNNGAACTSAGAPCATVSGVLAKGTFASGDTISVTTGTYSDHPVIGAKAANIIGSAAGVVFTGSGTTYALGVNGGATPQSSSLSNVTLTNGGFASGGALPVVNGTLTTTNVNITNSKSNAGAGAMVYGSATLNMTGGSITGNTATASAVFGGGGGAVYVTGKQGAVAAGSLSLDNVTVSGNVANGAAQVAAGNGGAIFNAGTTTIKNSALSANQAVASTSAASARRGQGGAIFSGVQDGDDAPVLTISNTTINGGLAAGAFNASSGGAIANDETTGAGTSLSSTLTATNVTLVGNTALLGGAIYNGGALSYTGGAINASTAYSGGAVYNSPTLVPTLAAGTSVTFDGTAFANNTASGLTLANYGNGGAIFNTATATVKNATFTGNKAVVATAGGTASGYGGAIWNGGYATTNTPKLTISDTSIKGGSASVGGAIANAGNVYAVAGTQPGTLDATNLVVDNNSAVLAGGIYTGGATNLTGGALTNNKATNSSVGYGGALYAATSTGDPNVVVTVDGVEVTGNTAAVVGGGVALFNGVSLAVKNGSSIGHNSAISGGGIYNAGAATVADSSVDHNSASLQGAGIYNGSGTATDTPSLALTDSSVSDNDAASSGGGVLTLKGATFSADGGQINGNSAAAGGGVIVADNATAAIDGTTLSDNSASAGGGALFNSGVTTLTKASLNGNHGTHSTGSTGAGAAIYSGSNSNNVNVKLTVDGSTIANNDGYAGSALVTYSPGTGSTNVTSIDRSTIAGNTNTSNIGAIEQFHPLTITNSTITGNTAVGGAGALTMVVPSTVGLAGNIVSGNGSASCTGVMLDGGYNLAAPSDTSCGFTVAKHDVLAAPQLGVLADNGGPTLTFLPGPASKVLDAVPAGVSTGLTNVATGAAVKLCNADDQRGTSRPQGAQCDIGSVEVVQSTPTVDGPASADYSVGNAGAPVTFTTTGTPQPTLSVSSALPAGITFTDNGDGTGTLAGTPGADTGGDHTVTVQASNEAGSATATFHLLIHQAPVLGGPAADTFTVGQAGGPDVFSMTKGYPDAVLSTNSTLPGGVSFTPQSGGKGTIAGTPAAGTGGVYPITIKGTNGTGPDATLPFGLTVNEAASVTGPSDSTFTVGTAGDSDVFAGAGFPTPDLTASGLPSGLSLVTTTPGHAKITGTPANGTGGVHTVTVTADNGIGAPAPTVDHVTVREAPEITGAPAVRFVTGISGSVVYSADGYPGAALTETGALPPGVTFVDNGNGTATLHGSAGSGSSGTYNLTIRASNGVDPDAVLHVTLDVVPPLAVSSAALPHATVGSGYGSPIVATGGQAPYHFTRTGGALPAGLSLAEDGTITGTPTGPAGTSSFQVLVTDSDSPAQSVSANVSLVVDKGASTTVATPIVISKISQLLGADIRIGSVSATVTGGSPAQPIAGAPVVFTSNGTTVCAANTNSHGVATCNMSLLNTLLVTLSGTVTATYAGSASWKPSSGSAGLIG